MADAKPKGDRALAWRWKLKMPWGSDCFQRVQDLAAAGASLEEVAAAIGWTKEDALERELRKLGWASYTLFRGHCLARTRADLRATMLRFALSGTIPAATALMARELLGYGHAGKGANAPSDRAEDEASQMSDDELNARLKDLDSALPAGQTTEPIPVLKRKRGRPPKYRIPQPPNMPDPKVAAGLAPPMPDPSEPLTGPRPEEPREVDIPLALEDDAPPSR